MEASFERNLATISVELSCEERTSTINHIDLYRVAVDRNSRCAVHPGDMLAADFGDVISGHAGTPDVYRDPALFFRNTHPARDLRRIVRLFLARGAEPRIRLQYSER
jgi:hypothetical protein